MLKAFQNFGLFQNFWIKIVPQWWVEIHFNIQQYRGKLVPCYTKNTQLALNENVSFIHEGNCLEGSTLLLEKKKQNKIKHKTFQIWNPTAYISKWGKWLQYMNGQSAIHLLHKTPLSLSLSLCVFFPHVDCCRQLLHRRLWTHFAALSDDGVVTQKPKHQPHQPMRLHRLHRRRLLDNDSVRSCGGCVCARLLVEETNHVPSPTKTTTTIIWCSTTSTSTTSATTGARAGLQVHLRLRVVWQWLNYNKQKRERFWWSYSMQMFLLWVLLMY